MLTWQLCVREQLSNTSLPSHWIVDPIVETKEKNLIDPQLFSAERLVFLMLSDIIFWERPAFFNILRLFYADSTEALHLPFYNLGDHC